MVHRPCFASENYSGVHPAFLESIRDANNGYAPSYGRDSYTHDVQALLQQEFGRNSQAYFVFNGTGANNFAIASVLQPYQSVFCTDVSHIYVDESTAPEALLGARLYPVESVDGKMNVEKLLEKLNRIGDVHHPQPGVITISQPTEYGTIYTHDEIKKITDLAKTHGLLVHMDGARLYNAAAAMKCSLGKMTETVDMVTLGGTKNGMAFGEAVLFFEKTANINTAFHLKRSMQLASKMRFIACQFKTMLTDDLWQELASHANDMAAGFALRLSDFPELQITRPLESNAVFVDIPADYLSRIQELADFYLWNKATGEARFMFSFSSAPLDIDVFFDGLQKIMKK
ncbi:MAG: aminotransferase class I/II-fold pyridoxal phosphate-dependent enzyme [Sediminibacterium sp.]|nr:aminotransferase class I/II-fold pyridoxal phosphate-dependent enzyme [Sediminibacterium sp.]